MYSVYFQKILKSLSKYFSFAIVHWEHRLLWIMKLIIILWHLIPTQSYTYNNLFIVAIAYASIAQCINLYISHFDNFFFFVTSD